MLLSGKTPDAVTEEIEAKLRRALAEPAVQERIRALGIEPAPGMSSEDAVRWIASQHDKWAKLIRDKGIRAE